MIKANQGRNFVSTVKFSAGGIRLNQGKLSLLINIYNPSSQSGVINGFSGSLIKNNTTVADIVSTSPTKLLANGKTVLLLQVVPNAAGILSGLLNPKGLLNMKSAQLSGSAIINNVALPVNL